MPDSHPAALPVEQLLEDCDIKRTRRSGPGGQHRNKVESAIVITHIPSGVVGQAGERRSQHKNRSVAVERLRENLAIELRSEVGSEQEPSELWRSRVRRRKLQISSKHSDFPAVLAEAMDFVQACKFEIPLAAKRLEISNSQLLKFIKSVPAALSWLNENRVEVGLKRLK